MSGSGRPIVLQGVGRLGSAILEGWLATGAVDPADLIILTPSEKPVAEAARAKGARINPPLEALTQAAAIVLAVKPALWREVMAPLAPFLNDRAVILSVMAGVTEPTLAEGLGGWPIVRVMPTTGVSRGRGVASVWSADRRAEGIGRALFEPMAETVVLADEALMDAATAVAGSGAAYFYAFTEALARAGEAAGLDAATADVLARADYVVCLAIANAQTENLIGKAALARMQKHAFFINLSRGNLVDEVALAAALRAGGIAGEIGRASCRERV